MKLIKLFVLTCGLSVFLIDSYSGLKAQELSMFQGPFSQQFYEDDRKITKQEFIKKINSLPESALHWKKYKTNMGLTIVSSIGTGIALGIWVTRDDGQSTTVPIIGTIAGLIVSSIFQSQAFKHQKGAILGYNKSLSTGYRVTPSSSGIGLAIHF